MRSLILPLLIVIATGPELFAQSISNGSLTGTEGESSAPPDWTTSADGVDTVGAGGLEGTSAERLGGTFAEGIPASPNGGTFVLAYFSSGGGSDESFSQTISSLEPLSIYRIRFYQANGGWSQGTSSSSTEFGDGFWEVSLGSATGQSPVLSYEGPGNQTWSQVFIDLVPQNATETLTFTARHSLGPDFQGRMAIDGITLDQVPEPGVLSLLGLGALVLLGVQSRKSF